MKKKKNNSSIYCCGCNATITARLTDGAEIYPHRKDLYDLPFWKCDACKNYVGCHHKTSNRTNPLGHISTPQLRKAKVHIHALIDPIWQKGLIPRGKLYAIISKKIGWSFHTANIKTIEEARKIYRVCAEIKNET